MITKRLCLSQKSRKEFNPEKVCENTNNYIPYID